MHLVGSDDRMFRFLDGDQVPKLVRLGDLALTNECGVRFEHTQNFVRNIRIPAQHQGSGRRGCGAPPVAEPTGHADRVPDHRPRRGH